jgi:hypothetical protein
MDPSPGINFKKAKLLLDFLEEMVQGLLRITES